MFYCDPCRQKNEWPTSIMRSRGKCESCGRVDSCHDVHHSRLERKPARKILTLKRRTLQ